jgi:hypothetical protein
VDEVTGRPASFLSDRLVLANQSFIGDPDKLDKISVSQSFRGRDLALAVFNGADLRKADFTGAVLTRASFQRARLQGADFGCAKSGDGPHQQCALLEGVDLSHANIRGASFRGAHLEGADLSHTNGEAADFRHASLQGADLDDAELQGADFSDEAKLQAADLSGAQLQGINLATADIRGANFVQNNTFEVPDLDRPAYKKARLWRAQGDPDDGHTDHRHTEHMEFRASDLSTKPWDNRESPSYEPWRQAILKDIPAGGQRDRASERLAYLNPVRARMVAVPMWLAGAGSVDMRTAEVSAAHSKELADFLKGLACASNADQIARGLLWNGRAQATRVHFGVLAGALWKGRSDDAACPAVRSFTPTDWSLLRCMIRRFPSRNVNTYDPNDPDFLGCEQTGGR